MRASLSIGFATAVLAATVVTTTSGAQSEWTALWNGKATQSLPHKSPFFNASYSYYRTGSYTSFAGHEGVPQGNIYFCGEHTSQDFQGFMEGGASTGQETARAIHAVVRGHDIAAGGG